jgi:hypothetical protein
MHRIMRYFTSKVVTQEDKDVRCTYFLIIDKYEENKCHEADRDARTNSEKYFLNALTSSSRIFEAKSSAVSGGQFWDGRKPATKNS